MCGIFGLLTSDKSALPPAKFESVINALFTLSESRGKESSGLALLSEDSIQVYKCGVPATSLIKETGYQKLFEKYNHRNTSNGASNQRSICLIGHARLVTNGALEVHENNQPVISNGLVGIHNGIIVNDKDLWSQFPNLHREFEVDTEIILALIRTNLKEYSVEKAVQTTFGQIKGAASIGVLFNDLKCLLLATNTGSLYVCNSEDSSSLLFASEKYILTTIMKNNLLKAAFGNYIISQVKAGSGIVVNLDDLSQNHFSLNAQVPANTLKVRNHQNLSIIDELNSHTTPDSKTQISPPNLIINPVIDNHKIDSAINSLKRCTKCLLPETMPFIEFDEQGVCNYCNSYKKVEVKGEADLEKFVASYRSKSGEPDCIATFSGGRDSSYGLHYLKTVLKMNPIAYSYDWGMITDLGRRNQARMCGQLGIEHVLVSADIKKKRLNIRRNIEAWFKNPHLGMIPLFMAGDKQYFYYANQLRKQTGIKLIVLCECPYEKTDFKSGFCGIRPRHGEKSVYAIPALSKAKLARYYAKQFIRNPAYINPSILDTMSAFFSYYMMPHEFLKLYDYIKWDEEQIASTLIPQYDWETANDTNNTWRIGDGTAPFYNYIYYTMAGFTENDTFRSNQIREGLLTREKALSLVKVENKLRTESFKWYCDTVGIDYKDTLYKISKLPRLFKV